MASQGFLYQPNLGILLLSAGLREDAAPGGGDVILWEDSATDGILWEDSGTDLVLWEA